MVRYCRARKERSTASDVAGRDGTTLQPLEAPQRSRFREKALYTSAMSIRYAHKWQITHCSSKVRRCCPGEAARHAEARQSCHVNASNSTPHRYPIQYLYVNVSGATDRGCIQCMRYCPAENRKTVQEAALATGSAARTPTEAETHLAVNIVDVGEAHSDDALLQACHLACYIRSAHFLLHTVQITRFKGLELLQNTFISLLVLRSASHTVRDRNSRSDGLQLAHVAR